MCRRRDYIYEMMENMHVTTCYTLQYVFVAIHISHGYYIFRRFEWLDIIVVWYGELKMKVMCLFRNDKVAGYIELSCFKIFMWNEVLQMEDVIIELTHCIVLFFLGKVVIQLKHYILWTVHFFFSRAFVMVKVRDFSIGVGA